MITVSTYKDRDAVIVESARLRAAFLPNDGAKMASLVDKKTGKELLATKDGDKYKVLSYDGSYVDAECSAYDDMFPTIDPYTPTEGEYAGITYPDHGEMCRLPFEVETTEHSVTFTAHSRLFDVCYKKTVSVKDDGSISIDHAISNGGCEDFPFVWAAHVMLAGEDGMRLHTPFDDQAPTEMIFATKGYAHDELPKDRLMGFEAGIGAAYKFYYLEKMREGRFSASYADGGELVFSFDKDKLPYLGVWLNNGEFQNIYNIAPEPCTVPFDAPHKAAERGYASNIPANGIFEFNINILMN